MEDFIHLHVHTYYSILDGQSSIQRLVDKAVKDGMRGMAITDHGDMFGIKEFHDICNSVNKNRKKEGLEPFKPIFGCEMYVARRGDKSLRETKEDLGGYHLIVLAKNANGYKNLIKLVSNSWVDGNPAENLVNITFSAENAESGVVSVMNLMGQTVYTANLEVSEGYNMITVPVKQLTSGVYMVTLQTNTGISTQKLVVK